MYLIFYTMPDKSHFWAKAFGSILKNLYIISLYIDVFLFNAIWQLETRPQFELPGPIRNPRKTWRQQQPTTTRPLTTSIPLHTSTTTGLPSNRLATPPSSHRAAAGLNPPLGISSQSMRICWRSGRRSRSRRRRR